MKAIISKSDPNIAYSLPLSRICKHDHNNPFQCKTPMSRHVCILQEVEAKTPTPISFPTIPENCISKEEKPQIKNLSTFYHQFEEDKKQQFKSDPGLALLNQDLCNLSDVKTNVEDEQNCAYIKPYLSGLTQEIEVNFKILKSLDLSLDLSKPLRKIILSKIDSGKKILFLDLDETLLHRIRPIEEKALSKSEAARVQSTEYAANGILTRVRYILRPYLHTFLAHLSPYYKIIVNHYI